MKELRGKEKEEVGRGQNEGAKERREGTKGLSGQDDYEIKKTKRKGGQGRGIL